MEQPISAPAAVESAPVGNTSHRMDPRRLYAVRGVAWLLIAIVLAISFREGLQIRRWMYVTFDPIRFRPDIYRGCFWALTSSGSEGYLNQYDKMEPQIPDRLDARWVPWLDYAPLRLFVLHEWGAWLRKHHPPDPNVPLIQAWQPEYDYTAPMLRFNTSMEIFGAVCAFFLTRHWTLRSRGGKPRYEFEGVWQGVVAALLLWFSPDSLISAHAWLTWDSWLIPWFLCTALLASLDWWFAAGLAMGVGAMFKGQELFVAVIFIVWPLMLGRPGAALRWICGLGLMISLIASGWLLTYIPPAPLATARGVQETLAVADYPPGLFAIQRAFDYGAATWIFELLLFTAAVPWLLRAYAPGETLPQPTRLKTVLHSRWTWIAGAAALIFLAAYWPFFLRSNRQYWYWGLLCSAALATAALLLRGRNLLYLLSAVTAGGLLSCMVLFHGGDGWAKCAFGYGLDHWPYMTQGLSSNVPAIFEHRFGWDHEADQIAFTLPAIQRHWPAIFTRRGWWPAAGFDVTAKMMFDSIYIFFLLLSAIAVGVQARRGDRRMLVALVTPWIMFFLWPVQIHERYLIFASGIAVCCIGNSVGTCLLWIFLSLCSAVMHLNVLFSNADSSGADAFGQNLANSFPRIFSPDSGQTIAQYVAATFPDMGWGILTVGMIFLYLSFAKSSSNQTRLL